MNILIHALPTSIDVSGVACKVRTDFRCALLTILCFEDNDLTQYEKTAVMLNNLYFNLPADVPAALERAQWFLNGGKEQDEDGKDSARVYSFGKDAELIYAAFHQTHRIDLETADLHWWKFMALFMDLGSDTTFCNLVSLRSRVFSGKATKEERATANAMGEMFKLPQVDTRTLSEREAEAEFMRLIRESHGG